MSRSTIANRRSAQFDKELELRDYSKVALAASAPEAAIAFPATKQMTYRCIVNVGSHTGYVAGTAQWNIAVEASADNVSFKPVGSVATTGAIAGLEIALSGSSVESVVPNAAYIRVTATKVGAPGNLTYGAFLALS
ncbi:hypothetical protein H6G00_00775 [Leptolyngbya sp. FACHB-541]|uniref:hypothetical protein n=1 Tax=Leptolyngbya sp. FACHB-541 TaxID=2692810 RepID=UPI001686FF3D|nr:hypothetical protein [Leptolyngbya sp. FACHB-541]MBD1995161.1 hypothetical protein [Leptolyngbya sp. FACHB-541]